MELQLAVCLTAVLLSLDIIFLILEGFSLYYLSFFKKISSPLICRSIIHFLMTQGPTTYNMLNKNLKTLTKLVDWSENSVFRRRDQILLLLFLFKFSFCLDTLTPIPFPLMFVSVLCGDTLKCAQNLLLSLYLTIIPDRAVGRYVVLEVKST